MSSAPDPPFSSVAIVGLGLIGGSIALAIRERWPASRVIGVDSPSVLAHVVSTGAIDRTFDSVAAVRGADLMVLAAPVCQNIELIEQIKTSVSGPLVVTDVGGTKREIVAAARGCPSDVTFVGGHPLGGAERGGFAFARADLFKGRPWIFTPDGENAAGALARLQQFVAGLGARPATLEPVDHDRLMAFLSHLPQLAASAVMETVGSAVGTTGLPLAGQGLIDSTRLASSPPALWRDICATNADSIGSALDRLIARLTQIRGDLERGDTLDQVFEQAARWRGELMKGRD